MKSNHKFIISLLILGLPFAACKKFVQIDAPNSELVTRSVFNNNSSATSAQIAIYSEMVSNLESANMSIYLGLLSDELTNHYTNNPLYIQFYTNAMAASAQPGPWDNAYNYIYQANVIISAIEGNSALSPAVSQQLLGEAKFIRAFWLFYLTNLYGAIPLATTGNYSTNATLSRTSQNQVYQQITSDLKDAQSLLNVNYVDQTDTTITTTDRGRPNKWAAAALLSRVYLYVGDNPDAEALADSVIGASNLYSLCINLNDVFLVNSTEAIWQLDIPLPTTINTQDGYDFILISEPGPSTNCCSITPQLMAAFEPNDNRKINWIDSFQTTTAPQLTYYYPYKYKVRTGSTVTEDVMVLRLAEQYLIRAEARVNQNDISGAVADLNAIRTRANLPSYNGLLDQQSVKNAILHERQVELFTEWGHRWLDLIRNKIADSVMSIVTPLKGGGWNQDGHQQMFPIPETEISDDPNLTQNLGYN